MFTNSDQMSQVLEMKCHIGHECMSARECLDPKPENAMEGLFPMCFTSQRQAEKDAKTQQLQKA